MNGNGTKKGDKILIRKKSRHSYTNLQKKHLPNHLIPLPSASGSWLHGLRPDCLPKSRKSYRRPFSFGLLLLLVIVPTLTAHGVVFIVLYPVVIPFGISSACPADRNEHKAGMRPKKDQSDGQPSKFISSSSVFT